MKASATMRRTGTGRGGRRSWPLILAALAALLASGCSLPGQPRTPDLAASQVFRYDLPTHGEGDIATLDPGIVTDAGSETAINLIYDGLVTLDQHLRVEDWGAQRIDVSADGLTYTFHLRAGQRFANGTPVTAANYAYGLDRALDPCLASPVSYYLFAIKDAQTFASETCKNGAISAAPGLPVMMTVLGDSITVLNANTLVITLAQPAGYFLEALTYPVGDALDPRVIGADPTNDAWTNALNHGPSGQGTSGMLRVSLWDHQNGKLVLKSNPYWWGRAAGKRPYLTEIDFSMPRDDTQTFDAFEHGQYDVGFPPAAAVAEARVQANFHAVPALTLRALLMDWTRPPYNNQDAREALCLAVNRDTLNQQVYGGQLLPTWHIVPQGMPGYDPALTGPDGVSSMSGDPTAARVHWQAYLQSLHGAPPPMLSFQYIFGSTSAHNLAFALARQWQAVLGITVTPKEWEWPDYLDAPAPHLVFSRFTWTADYPDPQDFLSLVLAAKAPYNPGGVNVPAADKLAGQADATSDPTQRYALYHQAEQLYVNAVALCPLFQDVNDYVVRGAVHGWLLDGRGLTPNDAWLATYIART